MATKEIGDMLNAIGQHAADILGKVPNDVFIYIEAEDQVQGGAVFDNLDDKIIYYDPSIEMCKEIQDLWNAAEPDKKWSILLFDIKDGKFEVEFFYTHDLEKDTYEHDYREEALVARFGDKPIVYPQIDEGDWHELTEEELADIEISEYDWETGEALPKE
jgi:hypothetical protein